MTSSPLSRRCLLRHATSLASAAVALALVGCATNGADPRSAKQQALLLERATAYWKAIKDNDLTTAWGYEEISKDPEWTLQAYMRGGGIVYEDVQVRGVVDIGDTSGDGNLATVDVKIIYSLPVVRVKGIKMDRPDGWVWLDNQWYHRRDAVKR